MLNKAIIIGRLTKDPELKYTQSGVAVTNFTVAVDRNFKNAQGEKETDFIPVVVWRQQAEHCCRYLGKGRLVAVSGRIQVRTYDDKDGTRRYVTEIVADEVQFLDWGEKKESNDMEGFQPIGNDIDDLPF
jgi:single-strand DNA-binding protein